MPIEIQTLGYDEWYERVRSKVYLWSSDSIAPSMGRTLCYWYYIRGLTPEEALLEWMRIHPLD